MENERVQFETVGHAQRLSCGRIAAMTSKGMMVTEDPVPHDFFEENRLKDLWGVTPTADQLAEWMMLGIMLEKHEFPE